MYSGNLCKEWWRKIINTVVYETKYFKSIVHTDLKMTLTSCQTHIYHAMVQGQVFSRFPSTIAVNHIVLLLITWYKHNVLAFAFCFHFNNSKNSSNQSLWGMRMITRNICKKLYSSKIHVVAACILMACNCHSQTIVWWRNRKISWTKLNSKICLDPKWKHDECQY